MNVDENCIKYDQAAWFFQSKTFSRIIDMLYRQQEIYLLLTISYHFIIFGVALNIDNIIGNSNLFDNNPREISKIFWAQFDERSVHKICNLIGTLNLVR